MDKKKEFHFSFDNTPKRFVDVETGEKLMRMIDVLEDLDDVSEVYSNADVPDEVLEAM